MKKIILNMSQRFNVVLPVVALASVMVALLVTATASASVTTQLDMGSQGSDVSELQSYLSKNPHIYPSGLVTGYFGVLTQSGIQMFQANQGIVSSGTPETTGFGRVGPVTMARLNSLMGVVYISGQGGDVDAPRMYTEVVTVDTNSATISWTTNESSVGRVMYGTSWPFVYSTAKSATSGKYGATTQVKITGLASNTTYYYVRESVDEVGNIMWTTRESFRTK